MRLAGGRIWHQGRRLETPVLYKDKKHGVCSHLYIGEVQRHDFFLEEIAQEQPGRGSRRQLPLLLVHFEGREENKNNTEKEQSSYPNQIHLFRHSFSWKHKKMMNVEDKLLAGNSRRPHFTLCPTSSLLSTLSSGVRGALKDFGLTHRLMTLVFLNVYIWNTSRRLTAQSSPTFHC